MTAKDRADVIRILIDKFNKDQSVTDWGRTEKTPEWYDNRSDIAILQELSWYHKFDPTDTCPQTRSH